LTHADAAGSPFDSRLVLEASLYQRLDCSTLEAVQLVVASLHFGCMFLCQET